MSEIKFRAWNSAENQMYYDVGICPHTEDYHVFDKDGAILDMYGSMPALMQFTGMQDKNGKPIFEGDIVRLYYSDESSYKKPVEIKYGLHRVGFDSDCASTGPALGFYFSPYPYDNNNPYDDIKRGIGEAFNWQFPELIEVIGNVYETPNLLQGKD